MRCCARDFCSHPWRPPQRSDRCGEIVDDWRIGVEWPVVAVIVRPHEAKSQAAMCFCMNTLSGSFV
jgi:hypothetical protein